MPPGIHRQGNPPRPPNLCNPDCLKPRTAMARGRHSVQLHAKDCTACRNQHAKQMGIICILVLGARTVRKCVLHDMNKFRCAAHLKAGLVTKQLDTIANSKQHITKFLRCKLPSDSSGACILNMSSRLGHVWRKSCSHPPCTHHEYKSMNAKALTPASCRPGKESQQNNNWQKPFSARQSCPTNRLFPRKPLFHTNTCTSCTCHGQALAKPE